MLSRLAVSSQSSGVCLPQIWRNDQVRERFADDFTEWVAERSFRRRIEVHDTPLMIDGDDAIERRFEDRRLTRFAAPERSLSLFAIRDVVDDNERRRAAAEVQRMRSDLDIDQSAVPQTMPPLAGQLKIGTATAHVLQ